MKQRIWKYLLTTLSTPRKEIGNYPICPFVKRYKDRILVVKSETPEVVVDSFATFKDVFALEAVVVYGFTSEFDTMTNICDHWDKKYRKKDVECLYMNPLAVDPPLPVDYQWRDCELLIIQRRSTLENARKSLEKGDYYTYFSEDD